MLVKSWQKILSDVKNCQEDDGDITVSTLAKYVDGDEDNIAEWINCDANDPGFEHLTNK